MKNSLKRTLSMALAVIMLALMLPTGLALTAAAADASYSEETVALINGVEVSADELQEVIDRCENGGTIELVKDCEIEPIVIEDNVWTIKGNGKTISFVAPLNNTVYGIGLSCANVKIEELTIKTKSSGISISDGTTAYLKNVNVYSGGTSEGLSSANALKGTDELNGKCSYAVNVTNTERALVTIDGGIYKAFGVNGIVLCVKNGNAVVKDGVFVGEDCSFVSRIFPNTKVTSMDESQASLTVYDGLFIKPVANPTAKKADGTGNSEGAVIRPDAGGVFNCYGGTYVNLSTLERDYVLLGGISSDIGYLNIFDGSFIAGNSGTKAANIIGNYKATIDTTKAEDKQKLIEQCYASIYGGSFYTLSPTRNANITTIAAFAEDGTTESIQHLAKDEFRVVDKGTTENVSLNIKGTSYGSLNGLTKYSFAYNYNATTPKTGAKITVTNTDGSVYYTDSLYTAVNVMAKDGATVRLQADVTSGALRLLNRNHKLTLDGAGKTITFTTAGLTVWSGDVTVKDVTMNVASGDNALSIGKDSDNTFELTFLLKDSTLSFSVGSSENLFKDLGLLKGTVTLENVKLGADATPTSYTNTYTVAEPTLPTPEEDDGGDGDGNGANGNSGNNENQENKDTTPAEDTAKDSGTDTDATSDKKGGCGSSIGLGAAAVLGAVGLCGAFTARKKRED